MVPDQATGLRLLHISDIHFQEPQCLTPHLDCDSAVRESILSDAAQMAERYGPVDAILITGDIAFKGHETEYQEALKWLYRLADAVQCSHHHILPVPGNHDVNRGAIKSALKGARALIKQNMKSAGLRNQEYKRALRDDTGPSFFSPIEKYNEFAARFRCDIPDPAKPFWVRSIKFPNGWLLKVHGLTTTFFSGPDDDQEGGLLMGDFQTAFYAEDGVIRLAMMHHPPDWLADRDDVDDKLWAWCSVHLFGHKHKERIRRDARAIRLAAAAVNPDPKEDNWAPGYNFIELEVNSEGATPLLVTRSHLRKWQEEPPAFFGMQDENRNEFFEHTISLVGRKGPRTPTKVGASGPQPTDSAALLAAVEERVPFAVPAPDDDIDPVFLFWELDAASRHDLVEELELLAAEDDNLTEVLRYRKAFERASDLRLEELLVQAIKNRTEEKEL